MSRRGRGSEARTGGGRASAFELTHPERVLWPDVGLTKRGLAEFYADIAERILPHVVNRPLALKRCPSGIGGKCFFQKHAWAGLNERIVHRIDIGDDEALAIRDVRGLIALVQAGVLELHPWGSRADDLDRPDRMIFDLDPGEGVSWEEVKGAALEVRNRLAERGLEAILKTTGGKGLHVVVPLAPAAGWSEVKDFAESIAVAMAKDTPDRYLATMAKRKRAGRIFVDYLRNGRGATAVAAYSTRARPGAPVATPVTWEELPGLASAGQFRVDNLATRLAHIGVDPWADLPAARQSLRVSR